MDFVDSLVRLKFNLVWNAEILDKSILKKLIIQYVLLRKHKKKFKNSQENLYKFLR